MTTNQDKYRQETFRKIRLDMLASYNVHICGGDLRGNLSVAWGGYYGRQEHVLRCANCGILPDDAPLVKRETPYDTWKQGGAVPVWTANAYEKQKGGRPMESTALQAMTESVMVERIKLAKFPQQLTPDETKLLAVAAITYGFDPLMGELTIYQGRPYVSIDGRYRKARETGLLDGVQCRPATAEEREAWSIPDEDFFFRAEVYVKETKFPFVGWGRVRGSETLGGKGFKPVETNPQRMAEKRAEAQALRKAFSIPLPSQEEIGMEDTPVQATGVVVEAKVKADPQTGEITNPPADRNPIDLSKLEFANVGQFLQACNDHFHLSKTQVLKEVPEFDLNNAGQRAKAWQQILAVYQTKEG